MATLTLGLTSGPVTGTKNYTLSDADVTRWLAALRIRFADTTSTNAQLLAKWADSVVAQAKSTVRNIEKETAAKTAGAAVTDIAVT